MKMDLGFTKNKQMAARRQSSKAFKILRKNYFQPRTLSLVKLSGLKVKIFSVMQSFKIFYFPNTLSQETAEDLGHQVKM